MDKHKKHDLKRRRLARIPGSRLNEDKAIIMEALYKLDSDMAKADIIVMAAEFALKNKDNFNDFINERRGVR